MNGITHFSFEIIFQNLKVPPHLYYHNRLINTQGSKGSINSWFYHVFTNFWWGVITKTKSGRTYECGMYVIEGYLFGSFTLVGPAMAGRGHVSGHGRPWPTMDGHGWLAAVIFAHGRVRAWPWPTQSLTFSGSMMSGHGRPWLRPSLTTMWSTMAGRSYGHGRPGFM